MSVRRSIAGLAVLIGLAGGLPAARGDVILSDNLSELSGGTEAATGGSWLAASFTTGTSAETLASVTLELTATAGSTALVRLFSNAGIGPGSSVGTLTAPASYGSGPAAATFGGGSIPLTANTTYWVVLAATSGEVDWSWASTDAGTGSGFTDSWASTDDAGRTWFAFAGNPTEMTVVATPSAVPEPGSLALVGSGLAAAFALSRRGHRRPVPDPSA